LQEKRILSIQLDLNKRYIYIYIYIWLMPARNFHEMLHEGCSVSISYACNQEVVTLRTLSCYCCADNTTQAFSCLCFANLGECKVPITLKTVQALVILLCYIFWVIKVAQIWSLALSNYYTEIFILFVDWNNLRVTVLVNVDYKLRIWSRRGYYMAACIGNHPW
jgi:hypothetical protein